MIAQDLNQSQMILKVVIVIGGQINEYNNNKIFITLFTTLFIIKYLAFMTYCIFFMASYESVDLKIAEQ
jgi:hypothetical protein